MIEGFSEIKGRKIAYLLDNFLSTSTTFVTNEVRYLYNNGICISAYALDRFVKSRIDPENEDLLSIATFTRPVNVKLMVVAHIIALLKYPHRYLWTLWQIIWATGCLSAQFLRAITHFMEGVSVGKQMADAGVTWIHVHFAGRAATAALVINGIYGIPYSITTHAYEFFVNPDKRYFNDLTDKATVKRKTHSILKVKLLQAQKIYTISMFNYHLMTEILRLAPEKIQIVRCGVDTARFKRMAKCVNSVPIILSVGNLVGKKGHEILLQACAFLKEQGLQFKCKIVGAGPLLEKLLSLRRELNLEDEVLFCGRVHHSAIFSYLEEADIFVLACLRAMNGNIDGIPVALMEAMAMEIPVVTTDLSGIPELVEHGMSGFLVKPNDSAALAKKIRQLLEDSQLRQLMGQEGRKKILLDYDQANNLPLFATLLFREMAKA
jgi:glycosyltransferase involved in cell wall biosynthesis